MPPILPPRTEISKILSNDPALKGWDKDNATFIFTDITFGKKDSVICKISS
jgi:Mitochondrial 28S ribosomal protein S22